MDRGLLWRGCIDSGSDEGSIGPVSDLRSGSSAVQTQLCSSCFPFPELNSKVNGNFLQRVGMRPSPFAFELSIKFLVFFLEIVDGT